MFDNVRAVVTPSNVDQEGQPQQDKKAPMTKEDCQEQKRSQERRSKVAGGSVVYSSLDDPVQLLLALKEGNRKGNQSNNWRDEEQEDKTSCETETNVNEVKSGTKVPLLSSVLCAAASSTMKVSHECPIYRPQPLRIIHPDAIRRQQDKSKGRHCDDDHNHNTTSLVVPVSDSDGNQKKKHRRTESCSGKRRLQKDASKADEANTRVATKNDANKRCCRRSVSIESNSTIQKQQQLNRLGLLNVTPTKKKQMSVQQPLVSLLLPLTIPPPTKNNMLMMPPSLPQDLTTTTTTLMNHHGLLGLRWSSSATTTKKTPEQQAMAVNYQNKRQPQTLLASRKPQTAKFVGRPLQPAPFLPRLLPGQKVVGDDNRRKYV